MLIGKAAPEDTSLHPIKYKWAYDLYMQAVRNTWFPHEITLKEDLDDWARMTEDERHAVEFLMSFFNPAELIVNRSLALGVYPYIKSPECHLYLAKQMFEEANHCVAFEYVLETFPLDRSKVYNTHLELPSMQKKEAFIHKYGYNDLTGRPDRKNFGGIHKTGIKHNRTNLTLSLIGFDSIENKIRNANGMIALVDENENIAASWNYSSLLLHWNRKHSHACYVPSISEKVPERKYMYGNKVILGDGTDFHLFLREMSLGNIYYDPGIKLENISSKPKVKRRSQFRIKSIHLKGIYHNSTLFHL